MKVKEVKNILLAVLSLAGTKTIARDLPQVKLVEELPLSARAEVYSKLLEQLNQNPNIKIQPESVLALHESGALLVLDKGAIKQASIGNPSCIPAESIPSEVNTENKRGTVYVFDKSIFASGDLGNPSCIAE